MKKKNFRENNKAAFLFLLPMLIGIFGLVAYPILESFRLSFYVIQPGVNQFVGFSNYSFALKDSILIASLLRTMKMAALDIVIGVPGAFIIASLINKSGRGSNLYKIIYYLPNITSIVATSLVFRYIFYSSESGLLNFLLGKIGIPPIGWFSNPNVAQYSIVIMSFWMRLGFNMLICLAGLQTISKEYYEAAEIDGASSFQKWWYITVPRSKQILLYITILTTITSMKRFGDVYVMGGEYGDPAGSLFTTVLYLYQVAFQNFNSCYGSTIAVILFTIIFIITLINTKYIKFGDSDV